MPDEQAYRMSYSYYEESELKKLLKHYKGAEIESLYEDHKLLFNKI